MTPTIALLLIIAALGFVCLLLLMIAITAAVVADFVDRFAERSEPKATDERLASLDLYGRRRLTVVPSDSARAGRTAGRVIGRGTPNGTKL